MRALQLHPDKNPDPKSAEKFQLLQTAKDTLTDEKLRRSYNIWLNSGIQVPFEQWQGERGHSMHWAPPRQMKLSLKHRGGVYAEKNEAESSKETNAIGSSSSLLEKFRRYEI